MRDNPLFYRKDGTLDLGQAMCLLITLFGLAAFSLEALGWWKPSNVAWAFLGSFVVSAFIVWASNEKAALLAQARSPGEVARGIAEAPLDTDPERLPEDRRD